MDVQHDETVCAEEDKLQIKEAAAPPATLDSARPAENAPAPATLYTAYPPPCSSVRPVRFDLTRPERTSLFPSTLLDSNGHIRTAPAPSVVLETRYDLDAHSEKRSYLVPLRELLSWHALSDVLSSIRQVEDGYLPIIYYGGTVVVGKYWCDIIHDGASFVVVYTLNSSFTSKSGVPLSKYWPTENESQTVSKYWPTGNKSQTFSF